MRVQTDRLWRLKLRLFGRRTIVDDFVKTYGRHIVLKKRNKPMSKVSFLLFRGAGTILYMHILRPLFL